MEKLKLKKNRNKGKIIVFEGTDGAGKTTLIKMLKNYLLEQGKKVIVIKQPTDMSRKTKLFQKMMYSQNHENIDYRAVQLLTMSDRIQHTHEVIIPAIREGLIVICDRYVYTSYVNMLARNYKKEKWFINVCTNLIKPNITFLAHVDPKIAIKRILSREEEKNRYLNKELLNKVSHLFLKLAKKENFCILDTTPEPVLTFNKVIEEIERHGICN